MKEFFIQLLEKVATIIVYYFVTILLLLSTLQVLIWMKPLILSLTNLSIQSTAITNTSKPSLNTTNSQIQKIDLALDILTKKAESK